MTALSLDSREAAADPERNQRLSGTVIAATPWLIASGDGIDNGPVIRNTVGVTFFGNA